jgi:hypothetical protein
MFYVLTGFDRDFKYSNSFWDNDFFELLKRIELLFKYRASPYIMLHENYKNSPYRKIIESIKKICNYPVYISNKTIKEAFIQSELNESLEYFKHNHSWFLDLRLETMLKDFDPEFTLL